jgi:hypothetical protein
LSYRKPFQVLLNYTGNMKGCKDIFIAEAIHKLPLYSGLSFHLEDKVGLPNGRTDILSVRSVTLFLLTDPQDRVVLRG